MPGNACVDCNSVDVPTASGSSIDSNDVAMRTGTRSFSILTFGNQRARRAQAITMIGCEDVLTLTILRAEERRVALKLWQAEVRGVLLLRDLLFSCAHFRRTSDAKTVVSSGTLADL